MTKPNNVSYRPLRVAFLIDNLDTAGTEMHLLTLISQLDRCRISPTLFLLDGSGDQSRHLEPKDCDVFRLELQSFWSPTCVWKMRTLVQQIQARKIDVLQMYFPDSTLVGSICGKLAGVPNLVRTRRNAGYWMTSAHRIRSRFIGKLVRYTLANNEVSRQSVIHQERASPKSVRVIPNGVDVNRFSPLCDRGLSETAEIRRIGMLSNLRPVKCVDVFIRAAAILSQTNRVICFEIAGEGPCRGELTELARQLGVEDRVHFLGKITDVPGFLSKLSILVSCSSSEGLSNTLLEAMAMELPVVATDIEGNRSVVSHNNTGLLFPVGNANALAESIKSLVEDQARSNAMGIAGRQRVKDEFSQSAMMSKYLKFYNSMQRRP